MATAKRSTPPMDQPSQNNTSQPQSEFLKTVRQAVGDPEYAAIMADGA